MPASPSSPPFGFQSFLNIAKARKYKTRRPTKNEKRSHIDLVLSGLNPKKQVSTITLDLKCCKTLKNCSNKWHWIELRDLTGRPGWIYQEADFIAFERKQDFIIVKRKNLVHWINTLNKIRFDLPFVNDSWEAKYRLYRRPNKKESITQIQANDLLQIQDTHIWKKIKE
tara:strand:+ start:46 stop:552 length:507 start_codon:yes stop_codon:yes gene_type:complete